MRNLIIPFLAIALLASPSFAQSSSSITISQLPVAGAITGAEVLPFNQLGGQLQLPQTKQAPLSVIAQWLYAHLPPASAMVPGGVLTSSAPTHQYATGVNSSGAFTYAQPQASDVSGLVPSATTDTTNAANITSGTLAGARLPAPSSNVFGGILAAVAPPHQYQTGNVAGTPSFAQPSGADLVSASVPGSALSTGAAAANLGFLPPNPTNLLSEYSPSAQTARGNLNEARIFPEDYCPLAQGVVACPADMTVPVQAAWNAAQTSGRPLGIDRSYNVTTIVSTGSIHVTGVGSLNGTATTQTNGVLDIQAGNITIDGHLGIVGNYNTNYIAGVYWHNSSQYSFVVNLAVNAAQVCWQIGSTDKPSALMSEYTMFGGSTYGCPIPAKIVGVEANVSVIGQQWSSDNFGVPTGQASAWAALPHRGVVVIGGTLTITGGELISTSITNGDLVEVQPMTGASGEGTIWGRVNLYNVITETASPLALADNPNNLTISSNYGSRGLLQFDGCSGFSSQDLAPFISTDSTFDGEIIVRNSGWWHGGSQRTHQNVVAGSTKTDVYVDDHGFGFNFQGSLAGTLGGTVHFSKRPVLIASGLNSQAISASNAAALLYQGVDQTGDLYRFASNYNSATGIFTVPPDGLKSITVRGRAQFSTGAGPTIYVSNATGGANSPVSASGLATTQAGSAGSVTYDASSLAPGQQIKILVTTPSSGGATAGGPDSGNEFVIEAAN